MLPVRIAAEMLLARVRVTPSQGNKIPHRMRVLSLPGKARIKAVVI